MVIEADFICFIFIIFYIFYLSKYILFILSQCFLFIYNYKISCNMKDDPLYWNVSKLRAKEDESEMYDMLIDNLDSKYLQKEKDSALSLKM